MNNITTEIIHGEHDDNLEQIWNAVRERRKALHRQEDRSKFFEYQKGDIVRFVDTARPQYLRGLKAEVIEHRRTKFVIRIVEEDRSRARRYGFGDVVVPPGIVEKVPE